MSTVVSTIYLQHDSPGKAREANWLPAPEALDGTWTQPPLTRVQ